MTDGQQRRKLDLQVRSEYFGEEEKKEPTNPSDRFAGPFKIGATLGRGITGSVKIGVHVDTGFQVALKCVKKRYLKEKHERWKTFRREMAIMKMMDHPHIIKLYDVFESTSRIFLVCEYVRGGELFDYISTNGLPKAEALRLFGQILLAIQHAHDYGVVHRDLKPENILLDEEKNIKIGDFGMARFIKDGDVLHTSCGSPHYTSPEVINGNYDGRISDVWSLGVIFYAMASGCLPFNHENITVMFGLIKAGDYQIPPEVDPDLCDLIRQMLLVDPAKRIKLEDIPYHKAFHGTPMFRVPLRPSLSPMSPTFYLTASPASTGSFPSPSPSPATPVPMSPLSIASSPGVDSMQLQKASSFTFDVISPPEGSPGTTEASFTDTKLLDGNVLEDMISLGGWESKEEIITKLQDPGNNLERGIYRLLSERKRTRLDELSRLSPRRALRSLPRGPSSRSSLATSSELRDLPEFELSQARGEESPGFSSYLDSPRSSGSSPRTPRVDLRVQLAKARRAKMDQESYFSPSKVKPATGNPSGSTLFGHLPEFITTDDLRSLQPYIKNPSSSSSTSSSAASTSSQAMPFFASTPTAGTSPSKLFHSGSDDWGISQLLKQLATTNRPRSPSSAKTVAPVVGSEDFGSSSSSPTSKAGLPSISESADTDLAEPPTTPKRSSRLPPKKVNDAPPSPAQTPSSPILQWFSNFFRRRPSMDPWAKGSGGKDSATARYQTRANTANRAAYLGRTYHITPTFSTSSRGSLAQIDDRSMPVSLSSPSLTTQISPIVASMSTPAVSVPAMSSMPITSTMSSDTSTMQTDITMSVSLESTKDLPLPEFPMPELRLPTLKEIPEVPLNVKIPEPNPLVEITNTSPRGTIPLEKKSPRVTFMTPEPEKKSPRRSLVAELENSPRIRALTTDIVEKSSPPRTRALAGVKDKLPTSRSIESEVKHRKRHTKERTQIMSPPAQPTKKKSFFGRYRRLSHNNSPASGAQVSTFPSVSVVPSSASVSSSVLPSTSPSISVSITTSDSSLSATLPQSSPTFLSNTSSYLGTTSSTYFGSTFGSGSSSFISSTSAPFLSISPTTTTSPPRVPKFFKPKKQHKTKGLGRKRGKYEKKIQAKLEAGSGHNQTGGSIHPQPSIAPVNQTKTSPTSETQSLVSQRKPDQDGDLAMM